MQAQIRAQRSLPSRALTHYLNDYFLPNGSIVRVLFKRVARKTSVKTLVADRVAS